MISDKCFGFNSLDTDRNEKNYYCKNQLFFWVAKIKFKFLALIFNQFYKLILVFEFMIGFVTFEEKFALWRVSIDNIFFSHYVSPIIFCKNEG